MTDKSIIPPSPSEEAYRVEQDQGEVFTSDDPIALFSEWLALAGQKEPNDPTAMALATVDGHGMPDVRIVLLKDLDRRGLTFFTNTESAKGIQLAENPRAALCFHWKTIRRQVRFRGAIEPVTEAEADAYFATRSRGSRIGAWASDQSRPLNARADLEAAIAAKEAAFGEGEINRPPHWSGYRLIPDVIEFWVNRPYRLHDRLVFSRAGDGWTIGRLYP